MTQAHRTLHTWLALPAALLFVALLVLDIAHATDGSETLFEIGGYLALAGALVTLAASAIGWRDLRAPDRGHWRPRQLAAQAKLGAFLILAAFFTSLAFRWPLGSSPDWEAYALATDVVGTLLVLVQVWIGRALVGELARQVREEEPLWFEQDVRWTPTPPSERARAGSRP